MMTSFIIFTNHVLLPFAYSLALYLLTYFLPGACVLDGIIGHPEWDPTPAEFELVQSAVVQKAIAGKTSSRGKMIMKDLNCRERTVGRVWRRVQTFIPVGMAYVLYAPGMTYFALFSISHPPFVFNRVLCVALILIVVISHYLTIFTPPVHVTRNPGPSQLAAAYRAAGLQRGAQSEGALTKYVVQVGARLPVRYHWCKVFIYVFHWIV